MEFTSCGALTSDMNRTIFCPAVMSPSTYAERRGFGPTITAILRNADTQTSPPSGTFNASTVVLPTNSVPNPSPVNYEKNEKSDDEGVPSPNTPPKVTLPIEEALLAKEIPKLEVPIKKMHSPLSETQTTYCYRVLCYLDNAVEVKKETGSVCNRFLYIAEKLPLLSSAAERARLSSQLRSRKSTWKRLSPKKKAADRKIAAEWLKNSKEINWKKFLNCFCPGILDASTEARSEQIAVESPSAPCESLSLKAQPTSPEDLRLKDYNTFENVTQARLYCFTILYYVNEHLHRVSESSAAPNWLDYLESQYPLASTVEKEYLRKNSVNLALTLPKVPEAYRRQCAFTASWWLKHECAIDWTLFLHALKAYESELNDVRQEGATSP